MDKTVFPYPFTDMQLRYALNLKQKRIFGNFSDPGTGKTGAFLLASRLIGQFGIEEYVNNAILNAYFGQHFPNHQEFDAVSKMTSIKSQKIETEYSEKVNDKISFQFFKKSQRDQMTPLIFYCNNYLSSGQAIPCVFL